MHAPSAAHPANLMPSGELESAMRPLAPFISKLCDILSSAKEVDGIKWGSAECVHSYSCSVLQP